MSSCTKPVPAEDVVGDERWISMHNRFVSETENREPDVLFIGDSIIQGLLSSTLWTEKITGLHCCNFGIGGDRVEHVLWRLLNGELEFQVPIKAIVLFVGTNNVNDTPEDIFAGIQECVDAIKKKLGNLHILLPTLLPRGQYPNRLREKNNAINELLLECYNGNGSGNVHVIPVHEHLVQSDETISHHIMYDYLHLTNAGYAKVFTPVYDKLKQLLLLLSSK